MKEPPKAIYLQFYGEDGRPTVGEIEPDPGDVTWCRDKIFDSDTRYVIDKRYLPKRKKRKSNA